MATRNGTITGLTFLSGNPGGTTAYDSNATVYCTRRAFLVMANFPAYTGSGDDATITGILTAIAASERNGKTLYLRSVVPAIAGIDTNAQGVHMGGASVSACTITNPTTTGDASGNLTDAYGTELASATASTGVGVIAVVDEV
jgi:hypothetical protein